MKETVQSYLIMSEDYDCSKNTILLSWTICFEVVERFSNKIYSTFLMEICSGEKPVTPLKV